ncbi:hypothetical protein K439DRAFT_1638449 [Ramaria rubella]|nr:hypothetical protein K439DRAFT_1638449 [Ramaria rubella]
MPSPGSRTACAMNPIVGKCMWLASASRPQQPSAWDANCPAPALAIGTLSADLGADHPIQLEEQ